jgi:hypothetical protein
MNLQLKNLKTLASLSEETHCFTATLHLDGKKVATISNHGHGGCDDVRWLDKDAQQRVAAHFAAQPKFETHGTMLQPDLEIWVAEQIEFEQTRKQARRLLKRAATRVVAIKNRDQVIEYKLPPDALSKTSPTTGGLTFRQFIEKRDGVVIINEMVEQHVYALIK